jgi:signal transduction histidine kinase
MEREDLVVALHDRLRNPLACLQGSVELLLDDVAGPLVDEQKVLLERVRTATARLVVAVEEIVPRTLTREE